MKHTVTLENWQICSVSSGAITDVAALFGAIPGEDGEWLETREALQIHEILLRSGKIDASIIETGKADTCRWVGDYDWIYRTTFQRPKSHGPAYIRFGGLDTVADIFLNGRHVASSTTMYLPCIVDVADSLQADNVLHLYFHRHAKMLEHYARTMPEEWRGAVPPEAMLRKAHDYGAKDGFHPIGIFDDVSLVSVDQTDLSETDMNVSFNLDRTVASIAFSMSGPKCDGRIEAELEVAELDGSSPTAVKRRAIVSGRAWNCSGTLRVENPKLWWPKNYGDQPLYRARFRVFVEGVERDVVEKTIGFREIRVIGSMKFEVNGRQVRHWGADIAPIWGFTNRFNADIALDLIDKADKGNINTMRIWGPSKPYPDEIYDACDARGILLWQDFPTGGSQMPDSPEYRTQFLAEAEHMIRRLKHHPSIFMWCGGNENIYMEELYRHKTRIGFEMLTHGYRQACLALDPARYYHVSSPSEGRYTNDPAYGDSHGSRALRSYCAGEQYAIFFSENIRVFPPQLKSFERFIGDDIWEPGYVDTKPFGCEFPMPPGWRKRLGNHGQRKLGPIGDYYSATNAQQLVYKFTAAAGQDIHEMIARSRRGKPVHKAHEESLSTGHMIWKFNDPWPNFYCAFVDYYGECSLPYYAARRAFSPVLVNFEVGDHVSVWGVNDTATDVAGSLEIVLYDLEDMGGAVRESFSIPVGLTAGESRIMTNLDRLGFFFWESVLYARLTDAEGHVLSRAHTFVTKENMLPFPDAEISLRFEGGVLTVTTDKFARCVELSGSDEDDAFGWFFEDNYFDLLPFETRTIEIYGRHRKGTISARGQYSTKTSSILIDRIE